ncbi:MAG: 1-acyl-sn-glycerol-3-phosphate acyltransferase, partial [Elainellaceae cyanobacterium]
CSEESCLYHVFRFTFSMPHASMPHAQSPIQDFYPPQLNPGLARLVQYCAPLYGRLQSRMTLEIEPSEIAKLKQLQRDRVLLMPNHPTYYDDWVAVFILSAQVQKPFYYLAAHERFRGLEGQFIQRLGAYSIRRGMGDRPSVAMTRDLLMQPACHLVIFPEGGCSYQNDTVMPFRTGAVQVAMQALSKLERQGEVVPDLYAVPLSIKYRYTCDMVPIIDQTLQRLEKALNMVPTASSATFYQRLRRVAEVFLVDIESKFRLDSPSEDLAQQSWNDRIIWLRSHILAQCEQRLNIMPLPHKPMRERVYAVQLALEDQAASLTQDDFLTYDSMHQMASNLLNFDAIYDGYVAESPTPERFLDTLIRLERSAFQINYPSPKAHRKTLLKVGDPINLKDYLNAYQGDRAVMSQQLTSQIQNAVQSNLDLLVQKN